MFHIGYRPAATEAHKTTIEFTKFTLDEPEKSTIEYFDRVRKKRHRTIYNEVGLVTEKEAKQLLSKAREFLDFTSEKLSQE